MNKINVKFLYNFFIKPYFGRWILGLLLVTIFSLSFLALPTFSGWFLTVCAIVFATSNTTFSYLFPAGIIRFLALIRTGTRYVEKTKNHETVLKVQEQLQLKIFEKLEKTSYFEQQNENHSNKVQHAVHGMDAITNHILLWFLPFCGFVISLLFAFIYLHYHSATAAIYFIFSAFALIIFIPKIFLIYYKSIHQKLQNKKLNLHQKLLHIFESRIELIQYNMDEKIIQEIKNEDKLILSLKKKLEQKGIILQHVMGLLIGFGGILLTYYLHQQNLNVEFSVAIFLMILTFSEMAENIWINRQNNQQFALHLDELNKIFSASEMQKQTFVNNDKLDSLEIKDWTYKIPNSEHIFPKISFKMNKGDWFAILGETGIGKSSLLNSLFCPEYQQFGILNWNNKQQNYLESSQAIYVTQQAFILSGTFADNFIGYDENDVIKVLKIVDLFTWFETLTDGFETFLGENGERMSGGQRKKLLLAQALLKQPQLLVIDEPTAGIDLVSTIKILDNIKHNYPDLTLIFVTHQQKITYLADKAVVL